MLTSLTLVEICSIIWPWLVLYLTVASNKLEFTGCWTSSLCQGNSYFIKQPVSAMISQVRLKPTFSTRVLKFWIWSISSPSACVRPVPVDRLDVPLPGMQMVTGSILGSGKTFFRRDWWWNKFYGQYILSLLLIQVRKLSVTGERMCTKYWLSAYV